MAFHITSTIQLFIPLKNNKNDWLTGFTNWQYLMLNLCFPSILLYMLIVLVKAAIISLFQGIYNLII